VPLLRLSCLAAELVQKCQANTACFSRCRGSTAGWASEESGLDSQQGQDITVVYIHIGYGQWIRVDFFPKGKRSGTETDHSHPFGVKVDSYPHPPPKSL
jgi:hypothetical protein